ADLEHQVVAVRADGSEAAGLIAGPRLRQRRVPGGGLGEAVAAGIPEPRPGRFSEALELGGELPGRLRRPPLAPGDDLRARRRQRRVERASHVPPALAERAVALR